MTMLLPVTRENGQLRREAIVMLPRTPRASEAGISPRAGQHIIHFAHDESVND